MSVLPLIPEVASVFMIGSGRRLSGWSYLDSTPYLSIICKVYGLGREDRLHQVGLTNAVLFLGFRQYL